MTVYMFDGRRPLVARAGVVMYRETRVRSVVLPEDPVEAYHKYHKYLLARGLF